MSARERSHAALTRRLFLRGLAAATAAAATPKLVNAATDMAARGRRPKATAKHQWAFVVDLRKCNGCEGCTEACQKAHSLPPEQTWIKVYKLKDAGGTEFAMPRLCMHCENAPCVRVCPVGATYATADGLVLVDQTTCIGCRMCMAACPYEARYFNWTDAPAVQKVAGPPMPEFPVPQQKGTVGKCILCAHNIEYGKLPACVEHCPMEALYIGDLTSDVATNGAETVKLSRFLEDNHAVRFKEELNTRPRVFYILGHGQNLNY